MRDFIRYIRFNDWWNYVIPPIMGWYFFAAWFFQQSIKQTFIEGFYLLTLAFATAAFGFVLNDLTDIEEDRKKGKTNYLARLSKKRIFLLMASCLLIQAAMLFLLRPGWLIAVHLLQILLFVVYSVPPIRLKGIWWIAPILDATFSGTLYYVIAFFTVPMRSGSGIELKWMIFLLAWGLIRGSRNILWHLYKDSDLDKKAKYNTLVHQRGITPERINSLATILSFLELGIFVIFLVMQREMTYLWWITGAVMIIYILLRKKKNEDRKFTINNLILEVYLPVISIVALYTSGQPVGNPVYLVLLISLAVIFPTIRSWFIEIFKKADQLRVKLSRSEK